jgi:hypothetical protein
MDHFPPTNRYSEAVIIGLLEATSRGASYLMRKAGEFWFIRPLFVAAILLVGLSMYQFKKINVYRYGFVAIGFGMFCGAKAIYAGHAVPPFSDKIADWVAVASAAYAISKGAEDVNKGMDLRDEEARH